MKTKISKLKYFFIMIVIAGLASCKGEIGPIGPAGTDGVDGTNGTDGNANVQTFIFNTPAWNVSGAGLNIDLTDIMTADVIENNAVLTYVKSDGVVQVYAIPGFVWIGSLYRQYVVNVTLNQLQIVSLEMNGSFTPNGDLKAVEWLKVVIIEPSNVTDDGAKSLNTKQTIYNELDDAGIDISDYYQVMDYYGLDY